MTIGAINTLHDVRAKLLGFSFYGVVRETGIEPERLRILEKDNSTITVWESEVLADLYGVDADALAEERPHVPPGEAVSVLASSEEFRTVSDATRRRIVSVANAARDLVALRSLLNLPPPEPPRISINKRLDVPYKIGADAANAVRKTIGPKNGAILSVKDWCRNSLGIDLLYASLGSGGPAGLTFAGPTFGPLIALNLDGKNENPCVRRFSLAHEIYHLLVDWSHREPLTTLSGYIEEGERFEREQRANAFAIRFLCPESSLSYREGVEAVRELMNKWGLHYSAARLYLRNARDVRLPGIPPPELDVTGAEALWERNEIPDGLANFPLVDCPPERRTRVAYLAAQAYARGLIPRDRFARLLGVTPAADVERVVGYFDMDPPGEGGEAAA